MQLSAKCCHKLGKGPHLLGWCPPLWKILDPPLKSIVDYIRVTDTPASEFGRTRSFEAYVIVRVNVNVRVEIKVTLR